MLAGRGRFVLLATLSLGCGSARTGEVIVDLPRAAATPSASSTSDATLRPATNEEQYARCTERHKSPEGCYRDLGLFYLRVVLGERGSIDEYRSAIEREPSRGENFGRLADVYMDTGKVNEAEETLKAAPDPGPPDDARAEVRAEKAANLLRRANILELRGDAEGAIAALEKARFLVSDGSRISVLVLYGLGNAYANFTSRAVDAIDNLKTFYLRVCKGSEATAFELECDVTERQLVALGAEKR